MKGSAMTENKNNDILTFIEKLKQDTKSCKDFLKSENKNPLLDKAIKGAFELLEKSNDKGGFLRLLFDYNKKDGWKNPSVFKNDIVGYFAFCDIDFHFLVSKQKLFLDYDKKNIVSFLEYKKAIAENKKDENEKQKEKASGIKLTKDLLELSPEKIDLLIIRLRLLKKEKQAKND